MTTKELILVWHMSEGSRHNTVTTGAKKLLNWTMDAEVRDDVRVHLAAWCSAFIYNTQDRSDVKSYEAPFALSLDSSISFFRHSSLNSLTVLK